MSYTAGKASDYVAILADYTTQRGMTQAIDLKTKYPTGLPSATTGSLSLKFNSINPRENANIGNIWIDFNKADGTKESKAVNFSKVLYMPFPTVISSYPSTTSKFTDYSEQVTVPAGTVRILLNAYVGKGQAGVFFLDNLDFSFPVAQ